MPVDGCWTAPKYETIGLDQAELEKMDYSQKHHRQMLRSAVENTHYLHQCFGRKFGVSSKTLIIRC